MVQQAKFEEKMRKIFTLLKIQNLQSDLIIFN